MKEREKCYNFEKKLFKIPLHDGSFGLIYVFSYEETIHSCICGLFSEKDTLNRKEFISYLWATPENFLKKRWIKSDFSINIKIPNFLEKERVDFRKTNYIGVNIYGGAIIWKFCQSFFGLEPWDQYAEPDFFDKMLIDHKFKPKNLIYENKV